MCTAYVSIARCNINVYVQKYLKHMLYHMQIPTSECNAHVNISKSINIYV